MGHRALRGLGLVVIALSLVAVACGSDEMSSTVAGTTPEQSLPDEQSLPAAINPPSTTESVVSTTEPKAQPTTTVPEVPLTTSTALDLRVNSKLIEVDPVWQMLSRPYFVYGVEADDRLNLRSGPGIANEVVGSISFRASGLTLADEVVFVGSDRWAPVVIPSAGEGEDGGAGWANLAFLRPSPATASIDYVGPTNGRAFDRVSDAAEVHLGLLADMLGPDGLRVSLDAFVDDSDVVLQVSDLRDPGSDPILWGFSDGEGSPVERTIEEHFDVLRGSTALTSTEAISVDAELGFGNTINNLSEVYPGATIVEYHFSGTPDYANLDWQSVRFVFDDSGERPILLAIVQAQWTI